MRRTLRLTSTLMIAAGFLLLAWAVAVWRWEDPLTSLFTAYEQRALSSEVDGLFDAVQRSGGLLAANPKAIAAEAARLRDASSPGRAIGRIQVPRLGLEMVVVFGTDNESLKRGPGLDPRTAFPGEGELAYIAGHRTTYAAPFSRIDTLRRGDRVTLEMPYGTFVYEVTGSRIVPETDLSVLRSKGYEQIALQACHPRFFASHRWIAYGRLLEARTAAGRPITTEATG